MKSFNQMTEEERKEFIAKRDIQTEELHQLLSNEIGSRYNLIIREWSNSRRTNAKRLNNWKLVKISPITLDAWNAKTFHITIESPKGIHKHLYDWEKLIKIG